MIRGAHSELTDGPRCVAHDTRDATSGEEAEDDHDSERVGDAAGEGEDEVEADGDDIDDATAIHCVQVTSAGDRGL